MAGHTFFGKRQLCYTEVSDFTDYQGIGHDPLYRRYDSVFSIVNRVISPKYQDFLATPEYMDDRDQIWWYVDEWKENPVKLASLSGGDASRYQLIKKNTIDHYKKALLDLNGEDFQIFSSAIKYIDDELIYCFDGKISIVAWGMTLDTHAHKVIGSVIHEIEYESKYKITFENGEHGSFNSKFDRTISRSEGFILSQEDLPSINPAEGYEFKNWEPNPIGCVIKDDCVFKAIYDKLPSTDKPIIIPPDEVDEPLEEKFYNCNFYAGENGMIEGVDNVQKLAGSKLEYGDIPGVRPERGFKFIGWDISPFNCLVDEDKMFIAQYEKIIPWYRRWWLWLLGLFTGRGCLRWLLWLLLFILGLWLLYFLMHTCVGCTGQRETNGVVPLDTITCSDGRVVDDNGYIHPIEVGNDGKLPTGDGVVAPVLGDGGEEVPILKQPGLPSTIANRLFLFIENENDNIDALAQDFKKAYPGNQYNIIGYDREVKLLVIQIPEGEREQIRQTINAKIPNHKFIVFDEEIYELNGTLNSSLINFGWHLKAIHLQEGWKITEGSANIKIAVVDDGIDPSHPMFKGRIIDAYNVFTQNNKLSSGEGHGTHTAALAAGNSEYYSKGASGVAPNCMLMPIQVFDNEQCPLSALISGVMYAVHHDADVVNISIGPSFKGLNQLPVETQNQISHQQFKNVERLWTRVCNLAAKKKCILVFSAGNDDILSSVPPENRNESAIVVSAVDENLNPTEFTNYGPCSDISAPGKNIYSAYPNNSFRSFNGTSMAAPIVSGTVALMKSIKKELTVMQVRNVLYNTGADVYGNIPPMVLVDKVLEGVEKGDFSRPTQRIIKPVPDGSGDDSSAGTASIINPQPRDTMTPVSPGETDYDAVYRKIAEYKSKIRELERLLPPKQKKQ